MDVPPSGFRDQLRAVLWPALAMVVCQVILETIALALVFRDHILTPYAFFTTQWWDFCVKMLLALPGAAGWLRGGTLDRFISDDFIQKATVGAGLLLLNVVGIAVCALVIASICYVTRRPVRATTVIWMLAAIGLAVHAWTFVGAVSIPSPWSPSIVVRNVGRGLLWDGAAVSVAILLGAAGAAALILRLGPATGRLLCGAGVLLLAVGASIIGFRAEGTVRGSKPEPATAAAVVAAPESAPPQGVILVSIDSLRADRLHCYGHVRETSPTIDRLAREGARFTDVTSTTSWTLPSHMSMFTGRYTLSHSVVDDRQRLPAAIPTLAEVMHTAGFTTGGVVSMIYLSSTYGFGRGFDMYDDQTIPARTLLDASRDEPAPKVTELATRFLREHADQKFFLFLHFWDVHYDYIPPPPYDRMFDPDYQGTIDGVDFFFNEKVRRGMPQRDLDHLLALYDGEIRWVDDHLAKIVDLLEELGVSDTTAVIITADHGDEFFEHGNKGHGRTLYREVVHVPLVIRAPGVPAGTIIDTPASLVDIMPTVLDLVGAPVPQGVDGVSFLPALFGGGIPDDDRAVFADLYRKHKFVLKALRHSGAGSFHYNFQPPRVEFYAADDRAERQDLAKRQDWKRDDGLSAITDWLNDQWRVNRGLVKGRRVQLDDATSEQLRALGYRD